MTEQNNIQPDIIAEAVSRREIVHQRSALAYSIGGSVERFVGKVKHRVRVKIGSSYYTSDRAYASFESANRAAKRINKGIK